MKPADWVVVSHFLILFSSRVSLHQVISTPQSNVTVVPDLTCNVEPLLNVSVEPLLWFIVEPL